MRAVARATAILSGGTLVKVAAGLVVAKVWAVLVGPTGVGTLGLMQSAVGLVALVAALGVSTGVVRLGASALGQGDARRVAAVTQSAIWMTRAAGVVAALAVLALREPLGRALLTAPLGLGDALWLGVGVGLTLVTGVQVGVLNAHHAVGALARTAVWGAIGGAVAGLSVLWVLRAGGLVEAYVASLAATTLASTWEVVRVLGRPSEPVSWPELRRAARDLLRFGLPFTGSALVGTGVMLVLPVVVLHVLDVPSVGLYRAALTVSAGYLGFLLTAMGQEYYPRVAAASDDEVGRLVNDQLWLVLVVGVPAILLAQATAPWTVPLIYAQSFAPAVPVLTWQLTGEVFRFAAWTFSYVLLARSSSAVYLAVETAGGAFLLAGTWGGLIVLGLVGSGIGFAVAYSLYGVVVWRLVCWQTGLAVDGRVWVLLAVAVAASLAMHGLPLVVPPSALNVTALALAAPVVAWAGRVFLQLIRAPAPPADA